MKKLLLSLFVSTCIFVNANDTIRIEDSITKTLDLTFNQAAIEESAYIKWSLEGDWSEFEYSFNQGKLKDNVFELNASDYKDFEDGYEGVYLCIKPNDDTKEQAYNLTMKVIGVSESLDFEKEQLDLVISEFYYQAPPPTPLWKKLLYVIASIIIVLFVAFLLYLYCKTFKRGVIQVVIDGDRPIQLELKGKRKPSLNDLLIDYGVLIHGNVVFTKKCLGYFDKIIILELDAYTALKVGQEFVAQGDSILAGQEVIGLKTEQNKKIKLVFTN